VNTQALIARLRERAATQDAAGGWSLDRAAADELERLAKVEQVARAVVRQEFDGNGVTNRTLTTLEQTLYGHL